MKKLIQMVVIGLCLGMTGCSNEQIPENNIRPEVETRVEENVTEETHVVEETAPIETEEEPLTLIDFEYEYEYEDEDAARVDFFNYIKNSTSLYLNSFYEAGKIPYPIRQLPEISEENYIIGSVIYSDYYDISRGGTLTYQITNRYNQVVNDEEYYVVDMVVTSEDDRVAIDTDRMNLMLLKDGELVTELEPNEGYMDEIYQGRFCETEIFFEGNSTIEVSFYYPISSIDYAIQTHGMIDNISFEIDGISEYVNLEKKLESFEILGTTGPTSKRFLEGYRASNINVTEPIIYDIDSDDSDNYKINLTVDDYKVYSVNELFELEKDSHRNDRDFDYLDIQKSPIYKIVRVYVTVENLEDKKIRPMIASDLLITANGITYDVPHFAHDLNSNDTFADSELEPLQTKSMYVDYMVKADAEVGYYYYKNLNIATDNMEDRFDGIHLDFHNDVPFVIELDLSK